MLLLEITDHKSGRCWQVFEPSQAGHEGFYHVYYFEKYGNDWRRLWQEYWDAGTCEERLGYNPDLL